ncbi:MAG: cupin domain-containing protein [Spirochaetaceae bacterium]|jgi:quercetin dioxygenase-like cupin family protein|nr:cupin domain-containing protein [Spirochaetaceae bacterium]
MTSQLEEIGARLGALRDIFDITVETMAQTMKISVDDYSAYERGQRDFSFSFLQNAALIFGVDVVDIISGESPKLTKCALVRKGEGYDIERRKAYDYKHLAFTFSNKKAEPFLVTVEPKEGETPTLHSHEGQEFDYMLSGRMEFHFDNIVYELNEGDSVYFDSGVPHAMKAVGNQAVQFLAVVIK